MHLFLTEAGHHEGIVATIGFLHIFQACSLQVLLQGRDICFVIYRDHKLRCAYILELL
ncbi:hypothetical protein D3C72_1310840 [compost metagenome]